MKTTLDNFLAMTSHKDHYEINTINTLPQDAIITIFAHLAHLDLCRLCLVTKKFQQLASSDILWQNIADSILLSEAVAAKSTDISYKDFCIEYLKETFLAKIKRPNVTLKLLPRNADFIQRLKTMKLIGYQLLPPNQTSELIQKEDTRKLLRAIAAYQALGSIIFHHVAQQQVEDVHFDFFNCTDYIVSFNSDCKMLINNKLTQVAFTPNNRQLFIIKEEDMIIFFNSVVGKKNIQRTFCSVYDLHHGDLSQCNFGRLSSFSKKFAHFTPTQIFSSV